MQRFARSWLLGFGIAVMPAFASAAPPESHTVGIAQPRMKADFKGHVTARVADALAVGIGRAGVTIAGEEALSNCADDACALEAARQLGLDAVITIAVTPVNPDVRVYVELHDGETGRKLAEADELCELCGEAELLQTVENLAARIAETLLDEISPPMVSIAGTPEGAEVFIDGEPVGVTPWEGETTAGPHALELRHPKYRTQQMGFVARGGVLEEIRFDLEEGGRRVLRDPRAVTVTPTERNPRPFRIGGYTAIGLGVAGIGAGAALIAVDGTFQLSSCPPESRDDNGLCPRTFATGVAGIVSATVGAAALGLGIGLVVGVAGQKQMESPDKATARVGIGPGSVSVRGRF